MLKKCISFATNTCCDSVILSSQKFTLFSRTTCHWRAWNFVSILIWWSHCNNLCNSCFRLSWYWKIWVSSHYQTFPRQVSCLLITKVLCDLSCLLQVFFQNLAMITKCSSAPITTARSSGGQTFRFCFLQSCGTQGYFVLWDSWKRLVLLHNFKNK